MEHFAVMKAPKLFMEKVIKAKVGTLQGKYKPCENVWNSSAHFATFFPTFKESHLR